MGLQFPHYQEIRLGNSPLVEVICQVRFQPILRIVDSEPSEFQDRIRRRFPALGIGQGVILPILQPGAAAQPPELQPRVYRFATDDNKSFVSLSVDFYAVSTNDYHHWGEFVDDLALAHAAITDIYQPNYATRIGLRFINRLTLANTGYKTFDEVLLMLRPQLTSQLHTEAWDEPDEAVTQTVLADGKGKLALRTALGRDPSNHAPFFVLDFDYFEEGKIELADLIGRCRDYHDITYAAFRWCFIDEGMRAFQPLN
jgi:uncharacterized protein (TIGR04255 family)